MWRRLSLQLRTIAPTVGRVAAPRNVVRPFVASSRHFSTESGNVTAKRVEDVMPIATGHEREELEAELQGKDLLEINYPAGPFGTKSWRAPRCAPFKTMELMMIQTTGSKFQMRNTSLGKEEPAVIKSYYDKRIVGCPGGEGEDEHDVVWFWLEKGKPHECPVCSQYFVLEVVGPGGPPDGHGDGEHHH